MKILVYPHELTIGGSQINAIDLAAGVQAAGHEVIVYGRTGPLVDYIAAKGLRFIPAREMKYRPAPTRIAQLARVVAREGIDLVHAYEWPPCLDAWFGARLGSRARLICTELSMSVSPFIPRTVPLIMGTADLGDTARRRHRTEVRVLEPPIDVVGDHPGLDGSAFRHQHDVAHDELLVVSVSRLAIDLKLDALVRAIDAIDRLAHKYPVRLIIVGGGPAHGPLLKRARAVNAGHGRDVISLPGALLDPRPAYAAADVVVGMGSSALRALAIGKPVVVQGEEAYSLGFAPDTLEVFLRQGFWGMGAGDADPCPLAEQIEALLVDPQLRAELGAYGRTVVSERFNLERAIAALEAIYRETMAQPVRRRGQAGEAARVAWSALALQAELSDPRRRRERHQRAQSQLDAAGNSPAWPPFHLVAEEAR